MLTIKQALHIGKEQVIADFELNLLLAHVLDVNTTWLRTWPEQPLTLAQQQQFEQLCQRRMKGEPMAYLLGEWSFWSFQLMITPDTLIPRPETEHLVEWVLQRFPATSTLTVADLGTGSGAIALALALERPHWRIIATDYSLAALTVAKTNARRLKLDNIEWYEGDWFMALPANVRCDVIVSNPPYIAPDDIHLQRDGLPFEPRSALVADNEGLNDIQHLIQHAAKHLMPQGWLALEHGYQQHMAVHQLFEKNGFKAVETIKDYGGRDRITFGQIELYL